MTLSRSRFMLALVIGSALMLPLRWESNKIRANGGKTFNQVEDRSYANYPVWSPNGKQIAYVCGRRGYEGICVINPDSGHPIEVINGGAEPQWSVDSKQLLFNMFHETGDGVVRVDGIFVINVDGTHLTQIADHGLFPVWSPDGKQIIFSWQGGLFVMNADGSHSRRLTTPNLACSTCNIWLATWSPNGKQIAFFVGNELNNKWTAYLINADGSHLHRLFETLPDVGALAWSPDSKRLATTSGCGSNWGICVMYQTSLKFYRLADGAEPGWSPDGKKIVFVCSLPLAGICTINFNGSSLRHVTNDDGDFHPTWSPDGQRIAFISVKNRTPDIYIINMDGTDRRRLTYSDSGS